jgi:endoglucanase
LTAQRVLVHGKKRLLGVMGSKPIHTMSDEEKKRCPEIKDYFIDTGLPVDEVQALVSVGDSITREQSLIQLGHLVSGKSLDNRLGVYVLVQALKKLKDIPVDFYAVFSTQEEVGIRGARVAAASIAPDMGLALDVTIANDLPDTAEHDQISHLGAGPAIKLADSGSISHKGVVNYLKGVAAKQGIACQLEILPKGGTDASGIQYLSGRGVATGALSIPLRYMHSSVETAHPRDIEQTVELLAAAISLCDPFPY